MASPGEFGLPWDVSFDDSSMLHVADRYNDRIQVLDQDGKYLREYGQRGSGLDNSICQPLYMLAMTMCMSVSYLTIVCLCLLLVEVCAYNR